MKVVVCSLWKVWVSKLSLNNPADARINVAVCNYFDSVHTIIAPTLCWPEQPAGDHVQVSPVARYGQWSITDTMGQMCHWPTLSETINNTGKWYVNMFITHIHDGWTHGVENNNKLCQWFSDRETLLAPFDNCVLREPRFFGHIHSFYTVYFLRESFSTSDKTKVRRYMIHESVYSPVKF